MLSAASKENPTEAGNIPLSAAAETGTSMSPSAKPAPATVAHATAGERLTTEWGAPVARTEDSLKAGNRGENGEALKPPVHSHELPPYADALYADALYQFFL